MKANKKLLTTVTTGVVDFNEGNWETNLQAIFIANGAVQDNVQAAIEFGYEHFNLNGSNNPDVFNYLIKLATGKYGSGMRSKTIQQYIETLTGLRLQKRKDGLKFCKKGKAALQGDLSVLDVKWYDFNSEGKAKVVEFGLLEKIEMAIRDYTKASTGELDTDTRKVVLKHKDQDDSLLEQLNAMLTSLKPEPNH